MGVYLPHTHGLPSTYQEVEYIESSGTQYINTGVKPTNKTKVINKGFLGNASVFYGVGRQSYYQSLSLLTDGTNYRGRCRSGSSSNSTVTSTIPWGTDVHIFEISQGDGFYIDGTKIGTFTSYTYTESYNIYVFGWSNRGTFIDGGIARLYYMEIYEDGTLIRNFIPCYRKSDSVIGLYDLVNNQFYTNSGTGTFTKGANVTAVPLKNAYIGEVLELKQIFDFSTSDTHGFTKYTSAQSGLTINTTNQYCKNNGNGYGSFYKQVNYKKCWQRIKGRATGTKQNYSLICGIGNNYAPSSGFSCCLGCNGNTFFIGIKGMSSYTRVSLPSGFDITQWHYYDTIWDNGNVTVKVLNLDETVVWSGTYTASETTQKYIGFSGGANDSSWAMYIKEYRLAYKE